MKRPAPAPDTRRWSATVAALWLAGIAAASVAHAEETTDRAPANNPNRAVSTSARLDFTINIGKFLFFRVGTGAFPTASATVDTVTFNTTPSIPGVPTAPVNGNSTVAGWNKTGPTFTAPGTVLPVEVRSNAGPVSLRATATTLLTSGGDSIPLSSVVITSSDANLPAPLVPDTGTGAAVAVAGTAFSNLVTVRSANWTFAYVNAASPAAGNYTGQITFTASAP
jgi:hypothetical protein